jgi:hypothetical protein
MAEEHGLRAACAEKLWAGNVEEIIKSRKLFLTLLQEYVNGNYQKIKGFSSSRYFPAHRSDNARPPGSVDEGERTCCARPGATSAARRGHGKSGARCSMGGIAGVGSRRLVYHIHCNALKRLQEKTRGEGAIGDSDGFGLRWSDGLGCRENGRLQG